MLTTIIPIGTIPLVRKTVWSREIDDALLELNDYIKSITIPGVYVFDSAQYVVDQRGRVKEMYALDELHLNSLGYEQIQPHFQQFVSKVIQDRAQGTK